MICFVASSGTQPTAGGSAAPFAIIRPDSDDEDRVRSLAESVGEGHLEFSGLSSM